MNTPSQVLILLIALIASQSSQAKTEALDVTELVEVTQRNKAQCIEYFEVKGKTYCSTKPLLDTAIRKEIADTETFKLNLNNHQWKVGWSDIKPELVTIEYLRRGQSIHDWKELITTQFFPGYPTQITPKMIVLKFLNSLQQKGFSPAVNFYTESNHEIIFEFQIFSPDAQAQDEIQKVIRTPKGIHIVHYVVKQADMGEKEREKWLSFIKATEIK